MNSERLFRKSNIKSSLGQGLALAGLLACLPSARCQEALDFVDTGGGVATGHLVLNGPLNQPQPAAPGSVFDPDGPGGPIPSLDLAQAGEFSWIGSLPILVGSHAFPGGSILGLFPGPSGNQAYQGVPPTGETVNGQGVWEPATGPDGASTSLLLAASFGALALVRRVRTAGS